MKSDIELTAEIVVKHLTKATEEMQTVLNDIFRSGKLNMDEILPLYERLGAIEGSLNALRKSVEDA